MIDLADGADDRRTSGSRQILRQALDRIRACHDAKEAGADLVMEVSGDLPALVFLDCDKLPVELRIVGLAFSSA